MPEPVVDGPRIVGGNGITRIIFPIAPVISKDNAPRHSFGVVYANEIALADMAASPRSNFRPGAIIVREKLSKADSPPKLLAAMIKRERGFNPVANDWEFLVLDGQATRVRKRLKKGVCYGCHQTQNDFVYGAYERK